MLRKWRGASAEHYVLVAHVLLSAVWSFPAPLTCAALRTKSSLITLFSHRPPCRVRTPSRLAGNTIFFFGDNAQSFSLRTRTTTQRQVTRAPRDTRKNHASTHTPPRLGQGWSHDRSTLNFFFRVVVTGTTVAGLISSPSPELWLS